MKKTILITIMLSVFVVVGAITIYASGGDILYTKPVKSVLFSHKAHENIGCGSCHSGLFEMKALAAQGYTDFNMDALYKGKYCGACHNGKQAFASNTQCARCHGGVKEYVAMKTRPKQKSTAQGPQQAINIGSGDTSVPFNHTSHASMACGDCHTKLFQMKKGTTKITFADHNSDKYCYSCHNGTKAFSFQDCNKCHAKLTIPGQITIGKGDSAVKFNHDSHTKNTKCNDCHNKLFAAKKGSSKITFAEHSSNKYCYACHNGKRSFGSDNCAACHSKIPAPKGTLTYKVNGLDTAHFSHDFHGKIFGCNDCHTKIFSMKMGATKMNMQGMYEGKYCGACHNSNLAFPSTDCAKCHYSKKK